MNSVTNTKILIILQVPFPEDIEHQLRILKETDDMDTIAASVKHIIVGSCQEEVYVQRLNLNNLRLKNWVDKKQVPHLRSLLKNFRNLLTTIEHCVQVLDVAVKVGEVATHDMDRINIELSGMVWGQMKRKGVKVEQKKRRKQKIKELLSRVQPM